MKITKEKYNELADLIRKARWFSLHGKPAQVYLHQKYYYTSIKNERIRDDEERWMLIHFPKHFDMLIYIVDPCEDMLRNQYKYCTPNDPINAKFKVDWDDLDYRYTSAYKELEQWYLNDSANGFKVFDILDDILKQKGIEVE